MLKINRELALLQATIVTAVSVLVIAVVFAAQALSASQGIGPEPKDDRYQAVFLDNGRVYFGKLSGIGGTTYTLKDVHYIQSNPQGDKSAEQDSQLSLVQLGNEVHGPESQMQILADKVLFWENLKEDSKVSKGIKEQAK